MNIFEELIASFGTNADGWVFMWVLAAAAVFAVLLIVERWLDIAARTNVDSVAFSDHIKKLVREEKVQEAYAICLASGKRALPRIFGAGLKKAGQPGEVIMNAMEEESLHLVPILEKRVDFIMMIGNVSTLIGLMGTIYGLILSFAAVARPDVDPVAKSGMLASGISTAMNTTLLGLMISVPCVMVFSMLKEKVAAAVAEIDRYSSSLLKVLLPIDSIKKDYRVTSKRIHEEVDTEPNIAPMMNLMVILIPLLLSSAEFVKIGAIELKLPESAAGGGDGGSNNQQQSKLDLGIVVTKKGFTLFHYYKNKDTKKVVAAPSASDDVDIPKKAGEYDYEALNAALADIRKKVLSDIILSVNNALPANATLIQLATHYQKNDYSSVPLFSDNADLKIVAEEDIKYQVIIEVMDAARATKTPHGNVSLFPNVSLAGGIAQ